MFSIAFRSKRQRQSEQHGKEIVVARVFCDSSDPTKAARKEEKGKEKIAGRNEPFLHFSSSSLLSAD